MCKNEILLYLEGCVHGANFLWTAVYIMQTHSVLLRIVAFALLVYSLTLFGTSLRKLSQTEAKLAACQTEYERLSEEERRLEEGISALRRGEGFEALARERLGLVMPKEKIFYFTSDSAAP